VCLFEYEYNIFSNADNANLSFYLFDICSAQTYKPLDVNYAQTKNETRDIDIARSIFPIDRVTLFIST